MLSGAIRDGFILGRGARDMKGLGTLQLATFLALHRSGVALNRDVVFLASADEEAGGFYGVGWLIENRPEIFEDIGILLNEGGGTSRVGQQTVLALKSLKKFRFGSSFMLLTLPGMVLHRERLVQLLVLLSL